MSRFLGLDSSTQSLSAIVIDAAEKRTVLDETVNFGDDLPHYNSPNGFLPDDNDLVKHSDPLMWVEALDLLLARARDNGFDWSTVAGISGSGQQHGSVYLNASLDRPGGWDAAQPLHEQVKPLLARPTSPIWMDSSTTAECREIGAAAGGDEVVARVSGSRPIERFTGPQIRRFHKLSGAAYDNTARIHLVSSFMASLLAGADAPIDYGDGAGMNLLDLASGDWSAALLEATAPSLAEKLPPAAPSSTVVGEIAEYFVANYGFRAGTPVVAWSGDNPCSLVGMGAVAPGTAVVSLGTSDTFFAAMSRPKTDPNGYGHAFGNPGGGFMSLICFKNGSLAREEVCRRFDMSWEQFSAAILEATQPGNDGNMMLPYFVPEITPVVLKAQVELFGSEEFREWRQPAAAARAIVEAQALSMRTHSEWIGEETERILVTGGGSQNQGILQVLADVFDAPLQRLAGVANSAALGAALRAANAVEDLEWQELFADFSAPDPAVAATPRPEAKAVYDRMATDFQARLGEILGA